MATVLVIDDERNDFEEVKQVLGNEWKLLYAEDGENGLRLVKTHDDISVVLLDIRMPPKLGNYEDREGILVLREIRKLRVDLAVIMLTQISDENIKRTAVVELGAYDFITKPLRKDSEELIRSLVRAAIHNTQLRRSLRVRDQIAEPSAPCTHPGLIGESRHMQTVYETAAKVAKTDCTVLLVGETGSGKTTTAEMIHQLSERRNGPFIRIDVYEIPGTLIETELFGYLKGAFTDATKNKPGRLEGANGGTLFLDNITELSLEMQAKLLHFLEGKKFIPVGGTEDDGKEVDVRFIIAAPPEIDDLLAEGKFHDNLFYRINVVRIVLPPLRDRKEDIPALAKYFLGKITNEGKVKLSKVPVIDPSAMEVLRNYSYPGNVRELEGVLEAACVNLVGEKDLIIKPEHLPEELRSATDKTSCHFNLMPSTDPLWEAIKEGQTPHWEPENAQLYRSGKPYPWNDFVRLYGELAFKRILDRAEAEVRSSGVKPNIRVVGRRLGLLPSEPPQNDDAAKQLDEDAFNAFRKFVKSITARLNER